MNRIYLSILLFLSLSSSVSALTHPYLLFNTTDIPVLQERFYDTTDPVYSYLHDNLLLQFNAHMAIEDPPTWEYYMANSPQGRDWYLSNAALLYKITNDPEYLERFNFWLFGDETIMGIIDYPRWNMLAVDDPADIGNDLARSHFIFEISFSYDVLYDDLTLVQRQRIQDKMIYEIENSHDGELDYWTGGNHIWYTNRPWQNHGWIASSAVGFAGYAFLEDLPQAQNWVDMSSSVLYEWLTLLPNDASWHEGISYEYFGFLQPGLFFETAERIEGIPFPQTTFFSEQFFWLTQMTVPGSWEIVPYANLAGQNGFPLNAVPLFSLLSTHYPNEYANTIIKNKVNGLTTWGTKWPTLLFYNSSKTSSPFDALEPYHYFDDLGMFVARNNWTSSSSFMAFKSGWYGGEAVNRNYVQGLYEMNNGHDHRDNNNVVFFADGEFILSDPQISTCPHAHFEGILTKCMYTSFHNLPVFSDSENNCLGVDINGHIQNSWDCEGQIYERGLETPQGVALFEEYMASEDPLSYVVGEDYTYTSADSHRLYSESIGLEKFQRQIIYYQDNLIIFDSISLLEPKTTTWNFYSDISIENSIDGLHFFNDAGVSYSLTLLNPQEYASYIGTNNNATIEQYGGEFIFLAVLHPEEELVSLNYENNYYNITFSNDRTFTFSDSGEFISLGPSPYEYDLNNDWQVNFEDFLLFNNLYSVSYSIRDLVMLGRIVN